MRAHYLGAPAQSSIHFKKSFSPGRYFEWSSSDVLHNPSANIGAVLMHGVLHVPDELGFENRTVLISDLYCDMTKSLATDVVPDHVGKGARRFLLSGFNVRKVHPLLIRG